MEELAVKVIIEKGERKLKTIPSTKSATYITTAYIGLRAYQDEVSIEEIAIETGYTPVGVRKLLKHWDKQLMDGDISAHLITKGYIEAKKNARLADHTIQGQIKALPVVDLPEDMALEIIKKNTKGYKFKLFNLELSKIDIEREREAIRESIKFMAKYGRGERPRVCGEYYRPRTGTKNCEDDGHWLIEESAELYCGCSCHYLREASENGIVKRREYASTSRKVYFEYEVGSLDEFIKTFIEKQF